MNIKSIGLALVALVTLGVIRAKAQDAALSTNSTADAGAPVADASAFAAPLVEAQALAQEQAADAAQADAAAQPDAAAPVAAPATGTPAQAVATAPQEMRPAAQAAVLTKSELPANPYLGEVEDYEFKLYGTADIGLIYNSQVGLDPKTGKYPKEGQYTVGSGVANGTFLGFYGRYRPKSVEWLEPELFLEATYNVDTGNGGSATNLNNAADTGAPSCTIAGATGTSCNLNPNGLAGLVFQREARVRLLFGRSRAAMDQHRPGDRDQLSIGRYYLPTLYNIAAFSPSLFGIGSPLALGAVNQGATSVRASNSLTYISRMFQGGWSVMAAFGLGERGRLKDGDVFGLRVGYATKVLHVAAASQFTFHPKVTVGEQRFGSVSVTNLGASYKVGILTAAAFAQYTRVLSPGRDWSGTFTQLHLHMQATKALSAQLTGSWLEVYRSPSNSGQLSMGLKYAFSKLLALNWRWTYVRNDGKAVNRNPGTPVVPEGRNAWSLGLGVEFSIPYQSQN